MGHPADGREYMDCYALRTFARFIRAFPTNIPAKPEPKSSSVAGSGVTAVVVPPTPLKPLPPAPEVPTQLMETWFSINEVASCPANDTSPFSARALPQRSVAPGSKVMDADTRIFPKNAVLSPRVAELVSTQNRLSPGCSPTTLIDELG
jgi:hypothetical protein